MFWRCLCFIIWRTKPNSGTTLLHWWLSLEAGKKLQRGSRVWTAITILSWVLILVRSGKLGAGRPTRKVAAKTQKVSALRQLNIYSYTDSFLCFSLTGMSPELGLLIIGELIHPPTRDREAHPILKKSTHNGSDLCIVWCITHALCYRSFAKCVLCTYFDHRSPQWYLHSQRM